MTDHQFEITGLPGVDPRVEATARAIDPDAFREDEYGCFTGHPQQRAIARQKATSALAAADRVSPDTEAHAKPHPNWKPGESDRHPRTAEEWDYRNDPVGGAFERSLHRLCVAGDYDDPRAPDEMALVLRIDLLRLIGNWQHKNAAWESWRNHFPCPAPDTAAAVAAERERCAKIADQFDCRCEGLTTPVKAKDVRAVQYAIAAAIRGTTP